MNAERKAGNEEFLLKYIYAGLRVRMMKFDTELLERIKAANDIVSVISEHVVLKRQGKNYTGLCPFHNEKTPSFSVTPEKRLFYCYGCGASGDVISFVQRYDNKNFPEAVEALAERAGIALPKSERSEADIRREKEREALYEVNAMAERFFHNCLLETEMGQPALAYLRGRGLSDDTIRAFKLGFAPAGYDRLCRAFGKRGVPERRLLALGLCRKNDAGQMYDYFRNRVMFPIHDGRGRTVGFGGRVMDGSEPKYLNSPETEIFNKGKLLFAFDKAYKSIRETKQAVLVEGYMDVIGAHDKGVTNVVASLGTAYTKDHGNVLVRQAEEIVLAYDMDGAGRRAAKRAIELLRNTDFKVRILAMPDGKDPDDYVRNHGAEEFRRLIAEAVKPFEYLLGEALKAANVNTPEGKAAVMNEMFPFIAATTDPMVRDAGLHALEGALWLDAATVRRYFRNYGSKKNGREIEARGTAGLASVGRRSESDILTAYASVYAEAWKRVKQYLPTEDIKNELHVTLLEKVGELAASETAGRILQTELALRLTEEEMSEYSRLMLAVDVGAYDEAALDEQIRRLRLKSLREQYKMHSGAADALMRAGDSAYIGELKKCRDIQTLIREWSRTV